MNEIPVKPDSWFRADDPTTFKVHPEFPNRIITMGAFKVPHIKFSRKYRQRKKNVKKACPEIILFPTKCARFN